MSENNESGSEFLELAGYIGTAIIKRISNEVQKSKMFIHTKKLYVQAMVAPGNTKNVRTMINGCTSGYQLIETKKLDI